ncbi:MAG: GNAT family N-acetyltransferase [Anaerolineales bacterium]|nr:GNAT family N-acetyltransferase [Anaerolineales bacterium]
MNNKITVTRIETTEQFENLREEWNTLLFQSPEKNIFLTWEWLFAWWKNIGQYHNELWLLLFREGDTLIAIIPLMMSRKKMGITLRWLGNIGDPDCDIGGFISINSEKIIQSFVKYIYEHKKDWDVFELMEVNANSPLTQQLLPLLKDSGFKLRQEREQHYYISLNNQTWEEYYNRLSKNMRHNLKRRMKRTSEIGNVTYKKYIGDTLTWKQFEDMFALSEKSNFPDLYKTQQEINFHKSLFHFMQQKEWIQIEFLYVDDRPIAFQYGFCFENRYEDWRGGIDKELDTLAPGKLLMMLSLEERFKRELQESDFLRGIYSYKLDWNPESREFTTIQVYDHTYLKSWLAYWGVKYIYPTLKAWMRKWQKKKTTPVAETHHQNETTISSIKTRLFNFIIGLKITDIFHRLIMEDSTLLSSIF